MAWKYCPWIHDEATLSMSPEEEPDTLGVLWSSLMLQQRDNRQPDKTKMRISHSQVGIYSLSFRQLQRGIWEHIWHLIPSTTGMVSWRMLSNFKMKSNNATTLWTSDWVKSVRLCEQIVTWLWRCHLELHYDRWMSLRFVQRSNTVQREKASSKCDIYPSGELDIAA